MPMSLHDHYGHRDQGSFFTSPAGLVLIGFLVIAGVLLFTEHRAHVLGALIWLPLLLCPADAHIHAWATRRTRRSWARRP
jgi:Protein of unknown function (DUF2933)